MARRLTVLCVAVLAFFVANAIWAECNTLTPSEKRGRWQLLFDGKTLNGWRPTGNPEGWVVEDGAIVNLAKGGGYLTTDRQFGDFVLSLEFKINEGTNSGVFFRWTDLTNPVHTGIEMQIYDSHGVEKPDRHDCGAIYDCVAPSVNACKPAGEWNKLALACRDNLIWLDMNGKRIILMDLNRWTKAHKNPDGTNNKFRTAYRDMSRVGHIAIQDHGGRLWLQNVKIKPLK